MTCMKLIWIRCHNIILLNNQGIQSGNLIFEKKQKQALPQNTTK